MINLDELTVGQMKEIKSMVGGCKTSKAPELRGKNIVILQRGWVFVGDLEKHGSEFVLKNGAVIRTWGTSNGLGELALEGIKSGTKLDKIPETKFHELTVIAMIRCEDSKWLK